MIEVEAKARAPEDAEDRILRMGGILIGVENHEDIYFRSPVRDFASTDEALRLRIKDDGVYLTYKGPKLDPATKTRLELTVRVDDATASERLLESLGFSRFAVVRKRRSKYRLGDAIVALDDVDGLGRFVEAEISADQESPADKARVLEIISSVGVGRPIRLSYLELLEIARSSAAASAGWKSAPAKPEP
ncbi:MAG: class IV adenylate cyclase [Methanothrix sp.]|uniref:class IV adenylate cyclase n=1 Tax=Methanothrix sp. TaxID=90426 RepID=UPI0025CDAA32|nr:class IV adenylate cyclase [Methanothrix sp.]MCQ8903027.1 class IV adenylate cyclase [Methanothrix sp.]